MVLREKGKCKCRVRWRIVEGALSLLAAGAMLTAQHPAASPCANLKIGGAAFLTPRPVSWRKSTLGIMRVKLDVREKEKKKAAAADAGLLDASGGQGSLLVDDGFRHASLAEAIETAPRGSFTKVGQLKLNLFGVYFGFMAMLGALPWAVTLFIQNWGMKLWDKLDPSRFHVSNGARTWSWFIVTTTLCRPSITGLENIPEGPVVYVANHASWMDVPFTGLLPFNPKYMAKNDLTKVPVLGHSMSLGGHVLIDRDDRKSQIEAVVKGRKIVREGNSLFVFAEGTRAPDGRLQPFKLGAFKIAAKQRVPIVPISIAGSHLVMPRWALMPVRPGRGVAAIHVHPIIPVEGKSDAELAKQAFDVINAALPPEQRHLSTDGGAVETTEPL